MFSCLDPSTRGVQAGLLAAVVLVGGLTTLTPWRSDPAGADRRTVSPAPETHEPFSRRLLVYGRHGLTPAEVAAVSRAAVGPVTAVHGRELAFASGRAGYPVVPVLGFTVDAASYAAAAENPGLTADLARGLVLSRTSARLRKTSAGGTVRLADGRRLRVSAVVADHLLGGYEAAGTQSILGAPASPNASYLLVGAGSSPERLRRALPDLGLRIMATTRNGFMSAADTVLTQLQNKAQFGEFAVSTGPGHMRLDPTWEATRLATGRLPQLGRVTCNKAVLPHLRAAMQEVTARGLGSLVHTADFQRQGGCWSPRVVRFGAGQISSHTWGIAVDINVDNNPLGATPRQDPRLVTIMAEHGFFWGGHFLRPDGAHFEWVGPR
ncbi:MAG: M15 family metallopeptidase [Mycobacteriales bacterium]